MSVTVPGDTIQSTFHHPYWVISGEDLEKRPRPPHIEPVPPTATTSGRWVDAGDLQAGDLLLLRDGQQVEIEDIRIAPTRQPVYNFSVAELSCYAVGPTQVLVHNNCEAEGASNTTTKEIFIDSSKYPQSSKHLQDAGALNRPLTVNRNGSRANRAEALRGKQKVPGMDLDEAPPAALRQPGDEVSVRPILPSDNRGAGASIGNQMRDVPNGGQVIFRPRS